MLVRTGGGLGGPHAGHLGEVPMAGRIEALEMLLGSAGHGWLLNYPTATATDDEADRSGNEIMRPRRKRKC